MKRLKGLYLYLICLPTPLFPKKLNAIYHLKLVCPQCPQYRRKMRDVDNVNKCWWHTHWTNQNFDIPKTFGIKNVFTELLFLKTDLSKYRKK